jgi:hypothetical protein
LRNFLCYKKEKTDANEMGDVFIGEIIYPQAKLIRRKPAKKSQ